MRTSYPTILVLLVAARFAYCQSNINNITAIAHPDSQSEESGDEPTDPNSNSKEEQNEASGETQKGVEGESQSVFSEEQENSDASRKSQSGIQEKSQDATSKESQNGVQGESQNGNQEQSQDAGSGETSSGVQEKAQDESQGKSQDATSEESPSEVEEESPNDDEGTPQDVTSAETKNGNQGTGKCKTPTNRSEKGSKRGVSINDEKDAQGGDQNDSPEDNVERKTQSKSSEVMATPQLESEGLANPENASRTESGKVTEQQLAARSKMFWTLICHGVSDFPVPKRTQNHSPAESQTIQHDRAQRGLQTETQGTKPNGFQTQQQDCARCIIRQFCQGRRQVNQEITHFRRRLRGRCPICPEARGEQSTNGENQNQEEEPSDNSVDASATGGE